MSSDTQPITSLLVQDDPSFADLVEDFVEGLQERVEAMRVAADKNDCESLGSLAHQLRGAGGGHGYPVLTEKAGILETSAKNASIDECRQQVDELVAICKRVVVGP